LPTVPYGCTLTTSTVEGENKTIPQFFTKRTVFYAQDTGYTSCANTRRVY